MYYDGLINSTGTIYSQLISPGGQTVFAQGSVESDRGLITLTESGTYKLIVNGYQDNTGNYSFRLIDANTAPTITLGTTVTDTITTVLATNIYRINGTAGQKLSFNSLLSGSINGNWYLYNTTNQSINGSNLSNNFTATLPSDGTYLLLLNGYTADGTVNYNFQVTDISDAPVTKSGFNTVKTGTIAVNGQDTYTLTAPAGLLVEFDGQSSNSNSQNIIIYVQDANNQTVTLFRSNSDTQYIFDQSGTYTLIVKNLSGSSADYSFQVIDPQTAATDLSLNTPINKTLTNGSETVVYRFNGTVGQKLYYDALSNPNGSNGNGVQLISPSGTNIFSTNYQYDSSLLTLTEAGTYYLLLEGNSASSVDYNFRLIDANTAPTITLGTTVTDTPGLATNIYQINGTAGQRLFFDTSTNLS
ncbi:MAG: hypothetical protein PT118_16615, partial [Aphanizomenon gracile PMC644.10]|nr:hypothetical protein [Aphanizomenon gracile PMC644.10]